MEIQLCQGTQGWCSCHALMQKMKWLCCALTEQVTTMLAAKNLHLDVVVYKLLIGVHGDCNVRAVGC